MTHQEITEAFLTGAAITYPSCDPTCGDVTARFTGRSINFTFAKRDTQHSEPADRYQAAYRVPSFARLAA